VSICPDSQAALKALKAVRTSPFVHQCQRALNDICTRHVVGLFWVPGHAGIRGNEIADKHARGGSAMWFLGSEPALGVSGGIYKRNPVGWLTNNGQVGGALVTPKDRPMNYSWDPVWVPRPNFCPSVGHNPGL